MTCQLKASFCARLVNIHTKIKVRIGFAWNHESNLAAYIVLMKSSYFVMSFVITVSAKIYVELWTWVSCSAFWTMGLHHWWSIRDCVFCNWSRMDLLVDWNLTKSCSCTKDASSTPISIVQFVSKTMCIFDIIFVTKQLSFLFLSRYCSFTKLMLLSDGVSCPTNRTMSRVSTLAWLAVRSL